MKQKLWFHGFCWKLMSTVDSTVSSYVPSLNARQLVDQKSFKSQHVNGLNASTNSHKKCSQVEISNLNNFCSIHCRALKFGTHEEELEPILLTNFQQKVQKLFQTLLSDFCCCARNFYGFLTWWWINRHAYNPNSPRVTGVHSKR